ncbi:HNH endonuclease [Nocardioidaceae bacterium]|nr:HNH endonuclease [Nocardioidaceae bacterium]
MTSLLDPAPIVGRSRERGPRETVSSVHDALDAAGPVEGLSSRECDALIAEVSRARARLQAYELRLVAAAAKTTVASDAGVRTTSDWLAARTRTTGAAAARTVGLAADLDDRLPATSQALDAGLVSREHAAVIAHAVAQLPTGLSAQDKATVEQRLVERSRTLDPTQLRRHARRVLEVVEPDPAVVDAHEDAQLVDEESRALAKARLTVHDNADGTVTGHFTVPHLAGSVLRKILAAMTAPRRAALGATQAQGAQPLGDGGRDWAHERGVAFAALLEHLPTDRLSGKTATTLVVTMDHTTLAGAVKAAGIDTGERLSSATTRRLACSSGLVPVVLGGESQPLDLGRQRRLFSEAQRLAGATRHTTCAATGCQTPYAWTELHHARPWSHGGTTDLADMVPLCAFHHRRIHDGRYEHRRQPDGTITFTSRAG